jgi:hypothetical protein
MPTFFDKSQIDANLNIAATVAPFSSEVAKLTGSGKPVNSSDVPATITQSERLFTTRSRSYNKQDGGGDRGERAYIKVLTTNTDRSLNRTDNISHGASNPTSLGTSSGGVLKDAVTGAGYTSFLLTDVRCSLEEKLQIVEVFGDAEVTYYFGRQPIMFNFSGLLIDSVDNNWFIEWIEMYAHVMRGTELARNYELIRIVLPNMTIEGTITGMSWSQNSARDVDIPFQFGFLAKQITPTPVVLPNKPLTNEPIINWPKAAGFLTQAGQNAVKLNSLKSQASHLQAVISDPLSSVKDYATSLSNFGSSGVQSTSGLSVSLLSVGGMVGGSFGTASGLFSGVNSNLNGVRASLFSPVYGVLSSLTKLIRGAGGDVSKVINSFTSPVRDILRDVRNISSQAIGIVNLVNNTIKNTTGQIQGFDRDIRSTLALLKKTGGVITSSPKTVSSSLKELFNAGRLPLTTKFIAGSGTASNKMALLNSGKKHTPESGAKL